VTFGALPAWQAWLLVAAAVAAAAWIFNIKVRPPRRRAPSLLIWHRVLADRRDLSLWERIRRAVSLAIALAIAGALAAAAARPISRSAADARVIVIDSAWSMAATREGGGRRWDRAVELSRNLARSAGGAVTLATTADGVVEGPTPDVALIERALGRLSPAGGESAPLPVPIGAGAVHFVTDGSVSRSLDPSIVVHSVFEPAPNVAIIAFDVRRALSTTASAQAYVELANFAGIDQPVRLTITRGAAPLIDRQISMKAGDVLRQSLDLPPSGGPRLRAHVTAEHNALTLDDEAVGWLPEADPVDITLVSEAAEAIATVLRGDPNIRLRAVRPADYRSDGADAVIFDRWLPASAPGHPALCIDPPSSPWLGTRGAVEADPRALVVRAHPVLTGVDPRLLGLSRVAGYDAAALEVAATSERQTPIVRFQDRADRRLVVFDFTADEGVRSAPGFPVLLGNAIEWLTRPDAGGPRRPGPVDLPPSTSHVTAPDGRELPIVRLGNRVLAHLPAPGLYLVNAAGSRSVISVNAGGPDVSNLMRTTLTRSVTEDLAAAMPDRPWWTFAIVAAFVLATLEWWTWHRRITV
jgi:hypothetical protein